MGYGHFCMYVLFQLSYCYVNFPIVFIHNQICCNVRYSTLVAIVLVDYYHSVCDTMSSVRA